MKKKILAVILAAAMVASLAACGSSPKTENSESSVSESGTSETDVKTFRVAFISDQELDASEWLINLVDGVKKYESTHDNVEIKMAEAVETSTYEPTIRNFASEGYDVIITTYSSMADATISVSKDYPDIYFGSLDGTIDGIENYSNIQEFGLNRTQTGYLAGIVAAYATETGSVGMVGGNDEPVGNAILAGWQQGLKSVNPDIVDYVSYACTYTDPTTGKDLGQALVDKGCDVIAGAAGGTSSGVAQAACENEIKYVGWDTHYPDIFGDTGLELGSALNYFDVMVIAFIEDVMAGNFQGGQRVDYGMSSGVCEFDICEDAGVSDECKAAIEEAIQQISEGKLELSEEPLHK